MWLMCRLTEINEKFNRFAYDHKDLSFSINDLILTESCRKLQCKQLNERRAVIKRRDPGELVMKQHADVFWKPEKISRDWKCKNATSIQDKWALLVLIRDIFSAFEHKQTKIS